MSGMAGDATLTRNMLGYAMLRDAGHLLALDWLLAPTCSF
jgi:hypothetical protein